MYKIKQEPIEISVSKFKKATDLDLIQKANLCVIDEDTNQDVTNEIVFDKSMVDLHEFNHAQRLPMRIKVNREGDYREVGDAAVTLVKKHIFRYILIALLLLAATLGLSMCHQQHINQQNAATNSQQDASISQNHAKIDQAMKQIDQLHDQIKQLKAATKQYQEDNDKAQFEQQLNNVQQQLQTMQNNQQIQSNSVNELLNKINQLISKLENVQNPQEANQLLSHF